MDSARQKRKKDIDKALTFIQSNLPYPEPGGYESFLIQLVCNLLDEGNASFKDGDWVQAIKYFSEGENVAQYATAEEIDVSKALLESLFVNRATAYYNLGHYESGVQDCDSALEVCVESRKSLYRKAMCLKELRRYREAYSCTMASLLAAPQSSQDKLMNDLAQELSVYLGLENQRVHVTGELRGTSGNGLKTASAPVSDMDTLEDFGLMGDDLDSLLDCFPNEPEATETHIQAALPDTVTYDASRKHTSSKPMIQMTFPAGLHVPKPLVTHCLLPAPTPRLPHSVLPAPTPCLPPAFFDSAVSELNSLDCFSAFGCTAAVDDSIKTPSLDMLDSLGRTSNGLDTLASVIGRASVNEPTTGVNPASLDMLDDLESLDDLLDSQPCVDEALGEIEEPGANLEVDVENCFDDSLDESLDYFVAQEMATGPTLISTDIPKIDMNASDVLDSLDTLDNLDTLDSFPVVAGARAALPVEAVREGGLDSLSDFSLPDTTGDAYTGRLSTMDETQHLPPKRQGTRSSYTAVELPPRFAKLNQINQKKRNGYVNRTLNPLSSTHDFMSACSSCFSREGKGIYSFVHKTDLVHSCRHDTLLSKRKAGYDLEWTRIRTLPARNFFGGPFVLCKELLQSGDLGLCKFGENCTFAFNQLEIDVWTEERKGTLVRTLLFEAEDAALVVTQLIQEHKGMFMFLCQECYDSKPTRSISRRCKNDPTICSNLQGCHKFDTNKCLVFVAKSTTESYSKIRPIMQQRQLELCRHAARHHGCHREDHCHYAHNVLELHTWKVQRETGIIPEEIEEQSRKYHQEQNAVKQKVQRDPKPPSSVGAVGGAISRTKAVGVDKSLNPNLRMKFACAQCWRDGLVSEPDKALKYCTAKASHSWIKERRVLLVKSLDRNKWVSVRSLPHAKNHPLQYEMCVQVLNQKKCNYTGNCTYAHSQEEKEMWTYMKNNDIKDLLQMYDMWLSLTSHNRQSDEAILTQPPVVSEEKNIAMPTDYAVPLSGFHCHLCGRNSNSERQWQQHISSEKHKDRFFSCEGEDEALSWSYRFPGPGFDICPRLGSECPEGASCDYAHSSEELHEWIERRNFLRRKLVKAREDQLILPDDFDFGKYNFLLQDQTH